MQRYSTLAIPEARSLLFGSAPRPLKTRSGMTIGGGRVYPELNFTLPAISIEQSTMPTILAEYREMITDASRRAVELEADGLVVEFETLPPMTQTPAWGIDVTKVLVEVLNDAQARRGLRSTLRVTPNDIREFSRPPLMRRGEMLDEMIQTFEGCAAAGAELLSIESAGGKEVHDDALMMGDMPAVIFALCVLGVRDMRFLWSRLKEIGDSRGCICAGDTACAFGNTAMVLAERKLISRVFAAVVRAVSAVRSLVAYECGALGPGKDCGYENPILKAITGLPMAMEGKTAACAHLSPVGNVAAAACDTWSNESVQNVRLLGAAAPTCYLEQLIYDCRLMNEAIADGPDAVRTLQRWLARSDAPRDPQAYVLTPDSAVAIAKAIVQAPDHYSAGKAAALAAVGLLRDGHRDGRLRLADRERRMLGLIDDSVRSLPDREDQFIAQMFETFDTTKFIAAEYGL